ncbi:hypothetical protein HK102_012427 [Quaeritorhiza haematococci]|nr:hypothetical protein HK102_012427 [Quaeritorhiza haematococci]
MSKPPVATKHSVKVIKLGILGAARIAPLGVIGPAIGLPSVVCHAVAARDKSRAEEFAKIHGIPKVLDSYQAVVEDPEIDAVYIALPNGAHFEWILKCIEAGKHVLCEKPFVSNGEQAEKVIKILKEANEKRAKEGKPKLFVVEAFHWRFHPLASRLRELISSGTLGELKSVEARLFLPNFAFKKTDIRFDFALAGGCLMDLGVYPLSAVRLLCHDAKPQVLKASARLASEKIDEAMFVELQFPDNGPKATIACDYRAGVINYSASIKAIGDKGAIEVTNFVHPGVYHSLKIKTEPVPQSSPTKYKKVSTEKHYGPGGFSTFWHQLRLFAQLVRGDISEEEFHKIGPTLESTMIHMQVVDDIYKSAGLEPRK